MRWAVVIGCLAVCVAPAVAGLDHVKAIAFDEKSIAALSRVKAEGTDCPVMGWEGTRR